MAEYPLLTLSYRDLDLTFIAQNLLLISILADNVGLRSQDVAIGVIREYASSAQLRELSPSNYLEGLTRHRPKRRAAAAATLSSNPPGQRRAC